MFQLDLQVAQDDFERYPMPEWPSHQRALPHAFARSALFGVRRRRDLRAMHYRTEIASWPDTTLLYSGPDLDQDDLDIWMHCVHLVRESGTQDRSTQVSSAEFLRGIHRTPTGQRNHNALKHALHRLTIATVVIQQKRPAGKPQAYYDGHLLMRQARDKQQHLYLQIDPAISNLFLAGYIATNWQTRRQLSGAFARWLHLYLQTHTTPRHQISLAKIRDLSRAGGSDRELRRKLRQACKQLAEVGVVRDFTLDSKQDVLNIRLR